MDNLTVPQIPAGFLATWCETLARDTESPPAAFLPSGLAMLSACVGPRLVMRWSTAHTERCNLWVLNVGASALARKTSGLAGLRKAIGWIRGGGDDLVRIADFNRLSDAGLVQHLDVVTTDTAKAVAAGEIEADALKTRDVPVSWLAVFNEVSALWCDDGPSWAMNAQQAMLSVYDGRLGSITRATNVPDQECFVTAIGNIPPGVLAGQTSLQMLSSGFVGRWLVIPTPPPERLISFPRPATDQDGDPLYRVRWDITKLMKLARDASVATEINGLWSDAAIDARHRWYAAHHARIAGLDAGEPISQAHGELFGRLQSVALKVATLIAVARELDDLRGLHDVHVTVEDVEWAHQVIDQSMRFVTTTLVESGADAGTARGKVEMRVIRALERAGATCEANSLTLRAVTDTAKGGKASRDDVRAAIDALIATQTISGCETSGGVRRLWLPATPHLKAVS